MSALSFRTRLRNGSTVMRIGNGREGKGREKEGNAGLIHPQVEATCGEAPSPLTVLVCRSMNEIRR